MDQCPSSRAWEGGPDLCNIAKVVESSFNDFLDLRIEGECEIKDQATVACLGERGDSSAIQ